MTRSLDTIQARLYRLAVVLLLASLLFILTGTVWYSTAKSKSRLVRVQNSTFAPFLNIIPSEDGSQLHISAGNVGEVGGTVFANLSLGPGHRKGGTMTYSDTVQAYITTITPGFTPGA